MRNFGSIKGTGFNLFATISKSGLHTAHITAAVFNILITGSNNFCGKLLFFRVFDERFI